MTLHRMKLRPVPFDAIATGRKDIELRLLDEKRQMIQPGDRIEFTCTDAPQRKLLTKVVALHCFDSFATLYRSLSMSRCGYPTDRGADPADMEAYYSPAQQACYSVVGIELQLIL